jgi:hypothetical protein
MACASLARIAEASPNAASRSHVLCDECPEHTLMQSLDISKLRSNCWQNFAIPISERPSQPSWLVCSLYPGTYCHTFTVINNLRGCVGIAWISP